MKWIKPVARAIFCAACLGAIASLYVAFSAWLGRYSRMAENPGIFLLFFGVFLVWFPTVIISQRLSRGAISRNSMKVALRGASPFMRRLVYAAFIYCGLVWAVSKIQGALNKEHKPGNEVH